MRAQAEKKKILSGLAICALLLGACAAPSPPSVPAETPSPTPTPAPSATSITVPAKTSTPPPPKVPGIVKDILGLEYVADGYNVESVLPGSFGLPRQIELLPNGDIVIADDTFKRLLLLSDGTTRTLETQHNLWPLAVAVLPDGRICYSLDDNQLILLDPNTGATETFGSTPPGDISMALAADDSGNIYAATYRKNLYRFTENGERTAIATDLPFSQFYQITDMDVATDGTIYVIGYKIFISVSTDSNINIITDDVHYEPAWCEVAPDGNVYFKDIPSGVRRYNPATGTITPVPIDFDTGVSDFLALSVNEFLFFYWGSDAIYKYNLETREATPVIINAVNNFAFAAGNDGALFMATPGLYSHRSSRSALKSHIIRLEADGSKQELTELAFDRIDAADFDKDNWLYFYADNRFFKYKNGEATSILHRFSQQSPFLGMTRMAVSPDGTLYCITTNYDDSIRVWTVDKEGNVVFLPITFNRASFGNAYQLSPSRIDVGSDGKLFIIVNAIGSKLQGPYYQRVYRANADGTNLIEIANFDSSRIFGMVDISVDMDNNVFVLICLEQTEDRTGSEAISRIDNDMEISKIVEIRGGRDPKSIDVDSDGNIWFSTTVGVFRATPSE